MIAKVKPNMITHTLIALIGFISEILVFKSFKLYFFTLVKNKFSFRNRIPAYN